MTRVEEIKYHLDRLAELIRDDIGLMYLPPTAGVEDPMHGRTTFIMRDKLLYNELITEYEERK